MPLPDEPRPLRVLFLDHTAQLGGGEIALLNLVRNLDRNLVHPVVVLWANGPLVDRIAPHAETYVVPLSEAVGKAAKDRLGWKSLLHCKAALLAAGHVFKMALLAKRLRVDLVHTNSLKADIIGGLAGSLARIPVIWHVRDRIDAEYLPAPVVAMFRRLCAVLPDYVIANSHATMATLQDARSQTSDAFRGRARTVHDGCEVNPLPSPQLPVATGARIGIIGRISPWKGQHIFLEAVALLRPLYPTVQFEIIGAPLFSERSYDAHLRTLCEQLDLSDTVQFAGFVENVAERIERLDIVVHASTIGEPFGQVIIEAMAAQKPVVATNGGGVPEILEDGVAGLLVPMGDAASLANALGFLLANPQVAASMGREGRQRVLARFTIARTARMVESVYRDVLDSRRPVSGQLFPARGSVKL